jgi:prepilin-type N-terminal cleavage/methylation domain-containing protein
VNRRSKLNRGEKACVQASSQRGRRGFSLIEVAVSSILVGSILVAAMTTTGAVLRFRSSSSNSARAAFLAVDLLAEILDQPYADPNQTPLLGRESGETTREQFDDADDYDGWTETPPATRAAVAIGGFTGWQRSVTVVYVQRNAPTLTSVTDEGLKRITVMISKSGVPLRVVNSLKANF